MCTVSAVAFFVLHSLFGKGGGLTIKKRNKREKATVYYYHHIPKMGPCMQLTTIFFKKSSLFVRTAVYDVCPLPLAMSFSGFFRLHISCFMLKSAYGTAAT